MAKNEGERPLLPNLHKMSKFNIPIWRYGGTPTAAGCGFVLAEDRATAGEETYTAVLATTVTIDVQEENNLVSIVWNFTLENGSNAYYTSWVNESGALYFLELYDSLTQ